jgi:16S rRNA (uracil1498-N3)-methyltransferase
MPRFYVAHPHIEMGMVRVEGSEVRHIRRVLRLRPGDAITLFDGKGTEYRGTIHEFDRSSVIIRIQDTSPAERESPLEITLAQSLLKGEKMDYLIQKATELGVKRIVPFFSSRSIPLLDRSKRQKRNLRWEKVAAQASKQCGRGVFPDIAPLRDYADIFQTIGPGSLRLILWETEGTRLKEVLNRSKGTNRVFFIVGPEGGFSSDEVEQAKTREVIPIHFGKRILRAETASLYLASVLQYEWGDMG